MIQFDLDEVNGLLLCKMEGFLSLADVDQYDKDLRQLAEKLRNQKGRVRLLIDASQASVQSADVTEAFGKLSDEQRILSSSDRLAVIVSTSLTKLQAQRMIRGEEGKTFVDVEAARQWLLS